MELVVIGVHTPKFPNEADSESVRKAILRYGVTHPVINDDRRTIWMEFGVRAWPTLILLDPDGRIIAANEGEATADDIITFLRPLVERAKKEGKLILEPLLLRSETEGGGVLFFPGKVIVDRVSHSLWVSDTGHHRILQIGLDGAVQTVIGSSEEGLTDGGFDKATFRSPQGLARGPDGRLFVADTGNHAIRFVDLRKGSVTTVAGTGELGRFFSQGGPARSVALRSPWDLALMGNQLFVAMAGSHQIWVMDLEKNLLVPFAGSSAEGIRDGKPEEARLAQPSGIALADGRLYFVDSESSSVRFVDLRKPNLVRTIVGQGLFDFGDRDGVGSSVLLQHPLGIAYHGGLLYVADSYNHKVKVVNPADKSCQTLAGTGRPGYRDGPFAEAMFNEPSGLAVHDGKIFVADTNNHRIRIVNLRSGQVSTLNVHNKTSQQEQRGQ